MSFETDLQVKAYELAQKTYSGLKEKSKDIEFTRYKQDCRKRALDLAHTDNHNNKLGVGVTVKIAADEYYQWLIEIPQ